MPVLQMISRGINGLVNCDICAEQKILVMNEMKWYKIWLKQNVLVVKHFRNLPPNFVQGLNKGWLEFCPFFVNES